MLGAEAEIRGPRNHFRLVEADSYLFVAGGIGITPILAMIRQATERGIPWTLLYGGRTRSSMAYLDELTRLRNVAGLAALTIVPEDELGRPDLRAALRGTDPGTAVDRKSVV